MIHSIVLNLNVAVLACERHRWNQLQLHYIDVFEKNLCALSYMKYPSTFDTPHSLLVDIYELHCCGLAISSNLLLTQTVMEVIATVSPANRLNLLLILFRRSRGHQ